MYYGECSGLHVDGTRFAIQTTQASHILDQHRKGIALTGSKVGECYGHRQGKRLYLSNLTPQRHVWYLGTLEADIRM